MCDKTKQDQINEVRMKQAFAEAEMSKCVKAKVGCILVNADGRIAGSGYNGTREGSENCCDVFPNYERDMNKLEHNLSRNLRAARSTPLGTSLKRLSEINDLQNQIGGQKQKHREWSALNEVHAEINMILSTDRKDYQGGSLYVTHKPCSRCAPVLAASGLKSVYYSIDGLTNDSDCSIFGSVELIKL